MKKISLLIIALAMLFAITGVVMADQPVPAVFSKQSMVTTTTANVDGTVMDDNSMAMTLTRNPTVIMTTAGPDGVGLFPWHVWPNTPANLALIGITQAQLAALGGSLTWHMGTGALAGQIVIDSMVIPQAALGEIDTGRFLGFTYSQVQILLNAGNGWRTTSVTQGMHTGILQPQELRATTSYEQSIVAQTGQTNYVRSSNLNTADKLIGQSTFGPKTTLTFEVTGTGGNAAGTEAITLNTLGRSTATVTSMASPFGPSIVGPVIPPYDNLVQAGGAFDITRGAVTTDANERFIANDASIPNALNYKINLKGITTQQGLVPALGSASGWIDVDVKEGRGASNTVSETIRYRSSASASGVVSGFTKTVGWLSGTNHV